jgi:hypothetical protein
MCLIIGSVPQPPERWPRGLEPSGELALGDLLAAVLTVEQI